MTETSQQIPVMRLTAEAYAQLETLAGHDPQIWENPQADFAALLAKQGITEYAEPTGITADTHDLTLIRGEDKTPNRWDQQALSYYHAFNDMSANQAMDHLMWTWLTHFHHHQYNLERWRVSKNTKWGNYVKQHWFFGESSTDEDQPKHHNRDLYANLHKWNGPARTWWIADTAIRAANASCGMFTAEQAVQQFSQFATQYHIINNYQIARNDRVLATLVDAMINDATGIKAEIGTYAIARQLNLAAGTLMMDTMPTPVLRSTLAEIVDKEMSKEENVRHSRYLRNIEPLRTLSLGGGVQSTVLALLIDQGHFGDQAPQVALFADTGWEPQLVYEHLTWLETQLKNLKIIRVYAEQNGHQQNIRENILAGQGTKGEKYLGIPAHLTDANGKAIGMARRQCTVKYKINPINAWIKNELGTIPGKRVPKNRRSEIWIGISTDEIARMKESREEWATNRHPLIEKGWSRAQCLNWFQEHYPDHYLPRSACIGCPYKSDGEWKWLQDNSPVEFQDAVNVDWALRNVASVSAAITKNGNRAFLHRSRQDLSTIDLTDVTDYDTVMAEECDGVCAI